MRPFAAMLTALVFGAAVLWQSTSRASTEEPLWVIVHAESKVDRVSAYELEALFTRTQTRWKDGSSVYPFSFPTGSAPRDQFDRAVLRLTPEQVGRFWLDRRIRGLGMPPKQVPSPLMMAQIIANLPGAVGYLPVTRNRTGFKVVARIVQGKVLPP